MRPAEQDSPLGRLRGRLGPVLADVRATRRDRRRRELHLPAADPGARREDRLLGDELPRSASGTPTNPEDPEDVEDWADRVFYRAVASSACATPWIALNEMWGSNLADAVVADERAVPAERDHLRQAPACARRASRSCSSRRGRSRTARQATGGARRRSTPTSSARSTSRAAALTRRADARLAHAAQRVPPGRHRPDRDRDPALEDRDLPRLPHEPRPGRPRRLKPASAWFDTIKLQVLAVKQVSREIPFATIWSWGWGEWSASDRDPDKPAAACVYLWTRRPGPLRRARRWRGPASTRRLDRRTAERSPRRAVHDALGAAAQQRALGLARVTGDREIAYTSLFARLVLKGYVKVKPRRCGQPSARSSGTASAAAARRIEARSPARRVAVDRARRDRGRAPAGADRAPLPGRAAVRGRRSRSTTRATRTRRPGSSRPRPPVVARPPPPGSRDRRTGAGVHLPDLRRPGGHAEDERRRVFASGP